MPNLEVHDPAMVMTILAYCVASRERYISVMISQNTDRVLELLRSAFNKDMALRLVRMVSYPHNETSIYATLHNGSIIWIINPEHRINHYPDMIDFLYVDRITPPEEYIHMLDIAKVVLQLYDEWKPS